MKKSIALLTILMSFSAQAWEGYDDNNNTGVTIGKGNLVRSGSQIQIYDTAHGEYHTVQVQTITGNGAGANVTVYDINSGEYRTLRME